MFPQFPTAHPEPPKALPSQNAPLARLYGAYAGTADPPADRAAAALAAMPPDRAARITEAAFHQPLDPPPDAPEPFAAFILTAAAKPAPVENRETRAARIAFHSQSDVFIPAFFTATLRNASTPIARAFYATGTVTSDQALRRIRHNTHHFYEIMLPGSLEPGADGWKLSLRIRLVHAQVRRRIRQSGKWDEALRGPPISAAHLALASANFSASILRDATRLGAILTPAARRGYMAIWYSASRLIGVPEDLLFHADERTTRRFADAAHASEPRPGPESIEISHALVNAIPAMAGETDPETASALAARTFRVSRALLGDRLADQLRFPRSRTAGLLPLMRFERHLRTATHWLSPTRRAAFQAERTAFLLERAVLPGIDYRPTEPLSSRQAADDTT